MSQKVIICGVDTSTLPRLTDEETNELLIRIKDGDSDARRRFVIANLRLVLSVIKRFWAKKLNSDDVFQAGCVGLIKAIDNFDLVYNVKFSTYAVPMIIGEIKRFSRDVNSMRVPRSIRDKAYNVLKARSELKAKKEEVTLENVAEYMNVAVSEVAYALDAIADTVSLYEPVYSKSGDTLMLMDQIGDEKNTDESWLEKVALQKAISKLNEREKTILKLRYFEGKTQTEISDSVGISQAQVSRLEKNVLKQLKQSME